MQRVLDLDLDYFLSGLCPLAALGERPLPQVAQPLPAFEVERFLEENCGLRRDAPVAGRIFPTHDEALFFWQELLQNGSLAAPFAVTHIDAHADLGIGAPGPDFVLERVLAMPPPRRARPALFREQRKLDEANYLLFALAFRWVGTLTIVQRPFSQNDIPPRLLQGENALKLWSPLSLLLAAQNGEEPPIPLRHFTADGAYHADAPFDFVSLALSPRYAPAQADALAAVIGRYIRLI